MKFGSLLVVLLLLVPGIRPAVAESTGGEALADSDPVVATISGIDIPASEFRLVMHRQMPSVVDYFHREHGLEDRPGYWADTGKSDSPIALLREKTLDELRRMKTQLVWAAKLGIPAEPSFAKLSGQLRKENERRGSATPPQSVIYGPRQYSLAVYYDIQFSETAYQLRQKLAQDVEVSEEKVRQTYEARKSRLGNTSYEEARSAIEKELALGLVEDRIREAVDTSTVQTDDPSLAAVQPRSQP